jgi:hypothetical protein
LTGKTYFTDFAVVVVVAFGEAETEAAADRDGVARADGLALGGAGTADSVGAGSTNCGSAACDGPLPGVPQPARQRVSTVSDVRVRARTTEPSWQKSLTAALPAGVDSLIREC